MHTPDSCVSPLLKHNSPPLQLLHGKSMSEVVDVLALWEQDGGWLLPWCMKGGWGREPAAAGLSCGIAKH